MRFPGGEMVYDQRCPSLGEDLGAASDGQSSQYILTTAVTLGGGVGWLMRKPALRSTTSSPSTL